MNTTTETVTVQRRGATIVEYTVGESHTYHANRYATFYGAHTGGGDARQLLGQAKTLWREADDAMEAAFKRAFPNADLRFIR